jgi:hypothetical protein
MLANRIMRGTAATVCAVAISGVMVVPAAALATPHGLAERAPAAEASSSATSSAFLNEAAADRSVDR